MLDGLTEHEVAVTVVETTTWFITIEEHGGHERHKDDKGVDHWPFSACHPETTQ